MSKLIFAALAFNVIANPKGEAIHKAIYTPSSKKRSFH